MKNLRIFSQNNNNNQVDISSEDIKNMIEGFESVQEVKDISETIDGDVLGYDINLSSDYIAETLRQELEDIEFSLSDDEESEEVLFEQAQYIGDVLVDSLKEYIENRYNIESFESAYDVYKADVNEGIALTLTLSFGKVKHGRLYQLASSINDKNFSLK